MGQQLLHPQYREQLRPVRYPFEDDATLLGDSGVFLPDDLFDDAILYPPGNHTRLYVSQVLIDNDQAVITIANQLDQAVGAATVRLFDPENDILDVIDTYGRKVGVLVSSVDNLAAFQAWPPGTHLFTLSQTCFAAGVCVPTPEVGLRGILLEDGTLFTGDVWIVGGDGVAVRYESTVVEGDCNQGPYTLEGIRIDIIGDPLFRRRLCADFNTPRFLTGLAIQYGCDRFTLHPNAQGNVNITVGNHLASDSVLRIRPVADGLVIEAAGRSIAQ